MRKTVDTYTGKPFRWNSTCVVETGGKRVVVPERMTSRGVTWLHPSRVTAALLAELNPTPTPNA